MRVINNKHNHDSINEEELVMIADEVCPESQGIIQSFLYSHPQIRGQDRYKMMWIEDYIGFQDDKRIRVVGYIFEQLMRLLRRSQQSQTVALVRVSTTTIRTRIVPEKLIPCMPTDQIM